MFQLRSLGGADAFRLSRGSIGREPTGGFDTENRSSGPRPLPERSLYPPVAIIALCILLSLVTILPIAGERRSSEISQLMPIESALATF
jgi:hypothetical protein